MKTYIRFDLPFVVLVRDGFGDDELMKWVQAMNAGTKPLPYARYAPGLDRQFFIVGGSLPVYLPTEELAPAYKVAVGDAWARARFLKRINTRRSAILMGEVPGDRTGRASFSSVLLIFEGEGFADLDARLQVNLAVEAVNNWLRHYRVMTDRPFIGPVTPEVIQDFEIGRQPDGKIAPKYFNYAIGGGPMVGFGLSIGDDIDAKLRRAVISDAQVDFLDELDIEIRNYLDLQQPRLALIESAILFEAFLKRFLKSRYEKRGLSVVEIDAKLRDSSGAPKSSTLLAEWGIKDACSFSFGKTDEYKKWSELVRDPRNDLVHGTKHSIAFGEALSAYSATKEAIRLLESIP